jgi:signal transduction histidine kinase
MRSGDFGAAWVQDHFGVVIYDHETEIIGQNVANLHAKYPNVLKLDERFLNELVGRGEYSFTVERGGQVQRKLVAWNTIILFNQQLTLALSAPDTEISALLGTSRQRNLIVGILLVAVFVVGGALIFYFQQAAMQRLVEARTAELDKERQLLKEQIREREWAENQVRQSNELLEQRVNARTAELTVANERLKDLDRLKTKFVSDISHELRTPIASLILNIDLMEKDSADRHAGYLSKIKMQANHVATMVKDILNLAKLEQETLYKREVLQLNEIVEQAIAVHQPLATAKALSVSFSGYKNLPLMCGSKIQLIQVVTNLLANAIHYTENGEIRLETMSRDGNVGLLVKDTGRGIDEEDLPYVFDRFYRGKAVSLSSVTGAGLGLEQVKEIVERFAGTIEVNSITGEGSEFRVWFPCISRDSECS